VTATALERYVGLRVKSPTRAAWSDLRAGLLGVAVLVPLAARDGGYWPTTWGWTALALFWVAALALLLRLEVRLARLELVLIGALLALFGWVVSSSLWGSSTTRPALEGERLLVYVAGCSAGLLLVRSRSYRFLLGGTWASITVVSAYSLATRLFPQRLGVFDSIAGNRLSEPIGYWNGLGIFTAVGVLLAVGFAARARSDPARALSAASLLVLLPTLYFTFSRGAWIALGVGLLAWFGLDPRRVQLTAALPAIAPWPALGVWSASRSDALTRVEAPLQAASREGQRLALILGALALVAALAAFAFGAAERRLHVARAVRLAYTAVIALVAAAALVGLLVRYGPPPTPRDVYKAFTVPKPPAGVDLNQRLFNLSGNGRDVQWKVAWEDYTRHPVLGSGAGSYEQYWLQHRPIPGKVIDAHSLYLETLAELGPVGLAFLLAGLGVPVLAAVAARRRALVPAAFAAYLAYLAHAAIDWDWELPGVTLAALFCGIALLVAARRDTKTSVVSGRLRAGALGAIVVLSSFAFVGVVGTSALAASERAATAGDLEKAEAEARKAARWAPWSSEPWKELAQVQLAQGDDAAARGSLRKAIAKDAGNWRLWYDLALQSESRSAQRRALARARSLNPLSPEIDRFRAALATARRQATRGER
jgi:hypothetical protein